jgi:hypothetical protein
VVRFRLLLLYYGERAHGAHSIGGLVGPRTVLDAVEKTKYAVIKIRT